MDLDDQVMSHMLTSMELTLQVVEDLASQETLTDGAQLRLGAAHEELAGHAAWLRRQGLKGYGE